MPDRTYTIEAVELPMPLDTLIKVGMRADVEGKGIEMPIEGISIALCPRRDAAAEGTALHLSGESFVTAKTATAIEAALLPYAVFDLGKRGWCFGMQVRAVRAKGDPCK